MIFVNKEEIGHFFLKTLQRTANGEFGINTKGFALLKHSERYLIMTAANKA